MTGVIATIPRFQFSNALGVPLARGMLYTYLAGTTTPATTWRDQALSAKNEFPVRLDARGECVLWLDPAKSYKFVLKDALGITQWTQDNVAGAPASNQERPVQTEAQVAAAGQAVFKLKKLTYTPGINSLKVYLDGFRLSGTEYTETASDTVTFKTGLRKDQEVLFETGSGVNSQSMIDAALIPYMPPGDVASNVKAALDNTVQLVDGQLAHNRTGEPGSYSTVGQLFRSTNNGTAGGYGQRVNFVQKGLSTAGFSIALGVIADFQGVRGSQGLASWLVAASPTDTTASFGVFGQEVNPMNRSKDTGYARRRGLLTQWTGGIQVIPEAKDLVGGTGNTCFNVTYAFAVAKSGSNKADGTPAKSYNGLMVEQDAIAPNGRGVLLDGDSTGVSADRPLYAIEVGQRWKHAMYTRDGIFDQGRAAVFGNNQWLAWDNAAATSSAKIIGVTSANDTMISAPKADGRVAFSANDGNSPSPTGAFSFSITMLSGATSYLQTAASTADAPSLSAQGANANVDVQIVPKGTGVLRLNGVRDYADDVAAAAGGVPVTGIYRTGSVLKVRVA